MDCVEFENEFNCKDFLWELYFYSGANVNSSVYEVQLSKETGEIKVMKNKLDRVEVIGYDEFHDWIWFLDKIWFNNEVNERICIGKFEVYDLKLENVRISRFVEFRRLIFIPEKLTKYIIYLLKKCLKQFNKEQVLSKVMTFLGKEK